MNLLDKKPWLIVPAFALASLSARADQVFNDDLIIIGSQCLGVDCNNGESFAFDTLRLKENNLRIRFTDTSSSSAFPTNDWQLTANDSANGGSNYFAIEDIDGATVPFRVDAGARTNALRISSRGIGIGTNPTLDIHAKSGNSPSLRLEQDGSSGFSSQAWDVGGNESNFFVRDVTNSSSLPLRISAGAPTASLFIAADGDVGLGMTNPVADLDVRDLGANVAIISNASGPSGQFASDYYSHGAPVFTVEAAATSAAVFASNGTDPTLTIGSASEAAALNIENTGAGDSIRITQTSTDGTAIALSQPNGSAFVMDVEGSDALTNRFSIGYRAGRGTSTRVWEQEFRPDGYEFRADDDVLYTLDNAGNLILAGTLEQGSSRAIKHHIQAVNPQDVLAKVMGLEMNRWVYRNDKSNTEHLGPMAEDFHAAFGLGTDNKHIAITDVAGVALASTQALQNQLSAQEQKVQALQDENAALKARLERLEKALLAAE